jgi:ribosomal-protein-alanine N-acetyltransferase
MEKYNIMNLKNIITDRLLLIPFTKEITTIILRGDFTKLIEMGFHLGKGYPDVETLDTIPKILHNLNLVQEPTGFESWMIVLKDEMTIIGDIGFKGIPNHFGAVDIGYGIIDSERKKGYASEATRGLIKWAFSISEVKVITAKCLLDNTDSSKILSKLNFNEVERDNEMIHWELQN